MTLPDDNGSVEQDQDGKPSTQGDEASLPISVETVVEERIVEEVIVIMIVVMVVVVRLLCGVLRQMVQSEVEGGDRYTNHASTAICSLGLAFRQN